MKLTQEPFLVNRAVSERESLPLIRLVNMGHRFSLAFTLIELLVVIAIVVVMAALLVPAQSRTRTKTGQIECVNNLRQAIQAELNWVHDSQKNTFHWRTPVAYGGLSPDPVTGASADPMAGNAFYQWWWIRNQLSNPKLLVCPADKITPIRKVATDWGSDENGLLNFANRDNAISYWVGTDAGCDNFVRHWKPPGYSGGWMPMPIEKCLTHVVTGDRNIEYNGQKGGCSALPGGAIVWVINWLSAPGSYWWTNSIHGNKGNLALGDGHVAQATSAQLTNLMVNGNDNGHVHALSP